MDHTTSAPAIRHTQADGLHDDQELAVHYSLRTNPILSNSEQTQKNGSRSAPTYIAARLKALSDGKSKKDWDQASSSMRDSQTSLSTDGQHASSLTSIPSVPQIRIDEDSGPSSTAESDIPASKSGKFQALNINKYDSFHGIALDIPSGGLEDIPTSNMEFSKRGSMLLNGKNANSGDDNSNKSLSPSLNNGNVKSGPSLQTEKSGVKVLSTDEEMLSQKVRTFYEIGTDELESPAASTILGTAMGKRWQNKIRGLDNSSVGSLSRTTSTSDVREDVLNEQTTQVRRQSFILREDHELAGGLEDWQDVNVADVDRYGFIIGRSSTSNSLASQGTSPSPVARDTYKMQRVATSLQVASDAPRRTRSLKRTPSSTHGTNNCANSSSVSRQGSTMSSIRPSSSPNPQATSISSIRRATNILPYNRSRRLMDEAGDMLTLPPVGRRLTEEVQQSLLDDRARRKEIEREEKWQKMARVVSKGNSGGGMIFDFDTRDPKLIERTWKGIPDRWRATAWYAFLAASARRQQRKPSDAQLLDAFNEYQTHSSPDDVQIDIDVPRTINRHIMFRRRYRGGQRLLFRVLHAMSLQFPETGYVQGMAALAATLLAYYEEERAFVMLVRLWDLRGLDRLYKSGFGGLIEALEDFEKHWLGSGELAAKLTGLGIGPTAYGTRWYLTLFNYSIPFSAQLRVWDVFMLLGDDETALDLSRPSIGARFGTTLDILHATSAALIDGMRDILLESDFEEAMKTLTSWIPIKDEDLFMRVAKAEYKVHKRKA